MRTSLREPLVRFVVKHPWFVAAVFLSIVGMGGIAVMVAGVVPIRASSGHWAVTARILDFAKLQSVKTYSLGIEPPDLQDEALVVRGAAHYAMGCEPCHGGPSARVPPVMAAMTPPPPDLIGDRLTRWNSAQLFSIVKHGIKFTGMPAWPVQQRDDEVWAVVAFLTRLPHVDATGYERLTGRDTSDAFVPAGTGGPAVTPPESVRTVCARCHGADGTGRDGAFPSLAAQRAEYLRAALRAFKDRSRFSATMSEIAARLDDASMREVASYYEQLPARIPFAPSDPAVASRGALMATRGIPEREIPACIECHGPSDIPRNPAYPRLAGQHASYLERQLDLLKQRRRGGSPRVNVMHAVIDRLGPQDMHDVARYFASLPHVAP